MINSPNTTTAAQGGSSPVPLFGIGDRAFFHWDDSGAKGGPHPPMTVTIRGKAEEHWRGPEGIAVTDEEDGVGYVALPHELQLLPNEKAQQPRERQ
jgi:hypothetical protein